MNSEKSILKDLKAERDRTGQLIWPCAVFILCISLYTCLLSLSDCDLFEVGDQEIYPFIHSLTHSRTKKSVKHVLNTQ